MGAETDLMSMLGVHLTVRRQPIPGGGDVYPATGRAESIDHGTRDAGKQQRGVLVARYQHHVIRTGTRESPQRLELSVMGLQDRVEPRPRRRLGATGAVVGSTAVARYWIHQLERIAVQDQVNGVVPFPANRLEEAGELCRPSEIFSGLPVAGRGAAQAHVQVAQHDRGSRGGALGGRHEAAGPLTCRERCHEECRAETHGLLGPARE